jgi:hypothetical protein
MKKLRKPAKTIKKGMRKEWYHAKKEKTDEKTMQGYRSSKSDPPEGLDVL